METRVSPFAYTNKALLVLFQTGTLSHMGEDPDGNTNGTKSALIGVTSPMDSTRMELRSGSKRKKDLDGKSDNNGY